MDEERRDSIIENYGLAKWTRNTLTKKDELLEELAEIRSRGYALDDGERLVGMRGIATPIRHRET
ncbi:IclR family transcriptional regulator domain-containing protein, partial [Haloferax marisrubri]